MYENLYACRELSEMSPESPPNTQQLDTGEWITEQEESQYDREQQSQHEPLRLETNALLSSSLTWKCHALSSLYSTPIYF